MKSAILFALVSTAAVARVSIAQNPVPIQTLQRQPGVAISGEVGDVVGNDFVLTDGTGQIVVDAGPQWYHQINIASGEQVTVVGEYDEGDFDAFSITRSNGEVIQIRPADGPPPWAGGPQRQDR
ncbi:DNA-binding protein [Almyronema epifaneia]|uniref:DNA-binding protein n=1 Tax=Almyronema epifaneia S1 TaxID=2991925 RepID=A0ABW6IJU2_9CYAN